ncbi:MAG: tyrosine-protein phosphatase [Thermoflexales bacterium]
MKPQNSREPQRQLKLEGAHNARDIGGYRTREGRFTRWGKVWRSDRLSELTAADEQKLLQQRIRTVIDMRFVSEVQRNPDRLANHPGVNYINLPLHEDGSHNVVDTSALPPTLVDYYRLLLDHTGHNIRRVFEHLAAPGALPALLHCTLGKDRTGIVTMLLLDLLGVTEETIVEDYLLTATYCQPLLEQFRAEARQSGTAFGEWHLRMLECDEHAITSALWHLRRRYGNAALYLQAHGLQASQIVHLQNELLEG